MVKVLCARLGVSIRCVCVATRRCRNVWDALTLGGECVGEFMSVAATMLALCSRVTYAQPHAAFVLHYKRG